jgi:Bacterial PH domain
VQTYGIPGWAKVIHVIVGSLMALIGVSIAIHPGNTGHPGTAPGYIAFGIIITALCIFAVTSQLTSRLVVTPEGLTWRVMLRTRSIAWADIQDVLVVPGSRGWHSLGVKAEGKLMRINAVIGSRRYTERIVTAIRAARPQTSTART